ncbi:MAG: hypothetical protein HYS86_04050 [Candidatus Chisholmbacteria bacterium]|nr:hypothetical protein [Candidatus Chisholmbacteria bacterium]
MKVKWQSVAVGLILGDGNLRPPTKRKGESLLDIKYSDRYLPYLRWLHRVFKPIGVNAIRPKEEYHQHRFYTKPAKELGKLYRLFYPKGKKCIPVEIGSLLTDPVSLAVWYMDDGSLDFRAGDHFNACIATYNFSRADCELLRKVFLVNFGLKVKIHRSTMRGKVYFRLYVSAESMGEFIRLISPHILPCFEYKISKVSQQPR